MKSDMSPSPPSHFHQQPWWQGSCILNHLATGIIKLEGPVTCSAHRCSFIHHCRRSVWPRKWSLLCHQTIILQSFLWILPQFRHSNSCKIITIKYQAKHFSAYMSFRCPHNIKQCFCYIIQFHCDSFNM